MYFKFDDGAFIDTSKIVGIYFSSMGGVGPHWTFEMVNGELWNSPSFSSKQEATDWLNKFFETIGEHVAEVK